MTASNLTTARRRVLIQLKQHGAMTAAELATWLEMTDVAARQHLTALQDGGFVESQPLEPVGRGRPGLSWRLTDLASEVFPDRHAELTIGLIEAARAAMGPVGVDKIIDYRASIQLRQYQKTLPGTSASLKKRVQALADRRSAEGYMAEVRQEKPGVYLLIEHHCPICEAAKTCTGLCAAELAVFRGVLGDDVQVQRTEHLLAEGDRCVYRIANER